MTTEKLHDFVIYQEGLCFASVCSSLPKREVKRRMAAEPCGTKAGWTLSDHNNFAGGEAHPCPCNQHPQTHNHWLFAA